MTTWIGGCATATNWLRTLGAAAIALPLIATTAGAAVVTIDFESEPDASATESTYIVSAGGIEFAFAAFPSGRTQVFDPGGIGTSLFPRLHPSTRSLAGSFGDGFGALVMGTRAPIVGLSFEIGLDIPEGVTELGTIPVTSPTAALLFGLVDGTLSPDVASMVALPLNRNFLVDQTISYTGSPYQAFLVVFAVPAVPGDPDDVVSLGYRPIASPGIAIDNVRFEIADAVPVPATLPLFAAGLAGLGLRRRRRR